MTTSNSAPTAPAAESKPGDLPILWAPQRGEHRHGISLWVNRQAPTIITPATATAPAKMTNPPHMIGYLNVEGATSAVPIAAWIMNGKNGTFVSVLERNKRNQDGSYSNQRLGTGNAVNQENGEPFPENRTPYMLFNIDGQSFVSMASAGAIEYMEELGFLPEVVDQYETLVEARKAQKTESPATRMRP
jgi:hypothetical protein